MDGFFDHPIPVAGDFGDSHGALFAQQCWSKGMGKCTYWNSDVRGMVCGLLSTTTAQHVVRAGLEAISYQMKDIIDPMLWDADMKLEELRVDGGPTNNEFLMQFTADILGTELVKNNVEELSALGAAYAGGLTVGFWKDREEIASLRKTAGIYRRSMKKEEAERLYAGWKKYVNMLMNGEEG